MTSGSSVLLGGPGWGNWAVILGTVYIRVALQGLGTLRCVRTECLVLLTALVLVLTLRLQLVRRRTVRISRRAMRLVTGPLRLVVLCV